MRFQLVVLKPFAAYRRGDLITDGAAIERILAGAEASFVVRVMAKGG